MRGCREHHDLRWGDIQLLQTTDGKQYLQYHERQTKTRPGGDPRNIRDMPPTMWSLPGSERDPVAVYQLYKSKRPDSMLSNEHPFYLGINHCRNAVHQASKMWFKAQPLGINKINVIMKTMFKDAGLQEGGQKVANHSGRKTMIQKLKDAKVPDTEIMQVSGHRNIQSLNTYSHMSEGRQEEISHTLEGVDHEQQLPTMSSQVPLNQGRVIDMTILHPVPSDASSSVVTNLPPLPVFSPDAKERVPPSRTMQPMQLFPNATITGGTISVTINTMNSPRQGIKRRRAVIESDSSSQEYVHQGKKRYI